MNHHTPNVAARGDRQAGPRVEDKERAMPQTRIATLQVPAKGQRAIAKPQHGEDER